MAKIKNITEEAIIFTDGTEITFDHEQDCCEYNYADFRQLDDIARSTDFNTKLLQFEKVDYGFRFGNKPNKMFFVPCYSEQNGYYTDELDIYLNNKLILRGLKCEEIVEYMHW